MKDPDLWQRLTRWRQGASGRHFAEYVDKKLKLHQGAADRLADEYVRFLYLAATSAEPLAPSRIIDEAWHLHLLDTRAWFDQFCPEVLGRTLHHVPGRPSPDRDPAYALAKERYLSEFAQSPPEDIWPAAGGHRRLRLGKFALYALFAFVLGYPLALHLTGLEPAMGPYLLGVGGLIAIAHFAGHMPMRKGERSSWGTEADSDGCGGD